MIQWIFDKILNYLKAREGLAVETTTFESLENIMKATVQDGFGYRYEIQVKLLGRIQGTIDTGMTLKAGSFMQSSGSLDV